MRTVLLFALFAVSIPASAHPRTAGTHGPDCSGGWPTNMTYALLKNAGMLANKSIDFTKTKTVRLASQRKGKDLWHQVYLVTFTTTSGGRIQAIAIHDASAEECSMSGVDVFVVSKHLRPEKTSLEQLFENLQSRDGLVSYAAAMQLVRLGKDSPSALKFLGIHLPPLLEKNMVGSDAYMEPVWGNGFMVAGKLKMTQAIPALIKHLTDITSPVVGISYNYMFRNREAVWALIGMGPPAVPPLRDVLQQGGPLRREAVAFILGRIGSAQAKNALNAALNRESDPGVKRRIEEALARIASASPGGLP